MSGYTDELARALARPDGQTLIRQVEVYADYYRRGLGDWPKESADDLDAVLMSGCDPEKALAYVVLAADRIDIAGFLNFMGCGPLEDILHDPSPDLLDRIVAEARRSPRFCWMLSASFKVAIAPHAWDAIARFRVTGPHEEPTDDTLPPR